MTEIVTAVYDSHDTLANVVEDLASVGIPSEKIRVHDEKRQVQVMTADATQREVAEILERHQPSELRTEGGSG